ncbi:hypothetical protein WISP_137443 [Willisornis vidua]|uniref:Uncharacterized protein n=1 Tax=Willisornis vidua TaxID=1566151 RepID=A0ABQ9CN24_9PASS|nr:hypothetical protein WISP_137443 [Willisornis vidua]
MPCYPPVTLHETIPILPETTVEVPMSLSRCLGYGTRYEIFSWRRDSVITTVSAINFSRKRNLLYATVRDRKTKLEMDLWQFSELAVPFLPGIINSTDVPPVKEVMKDMNLQLHVKASQSNVNTVFLLSFTSRQYMEIELPYRNVTHFYRKEKGSQADEGPIPDLTFAMGIDDQVTVTHLVDEEKAVDVVYLEFIKAFDTVSQRIFLEKLAAHGLDKCTI